MTGLAQQDFWREVLSGLVTNLIWACITTLLATAYFLRRDRSRFSGRWSSQIQWSTEWASTMLFGRACEDPHSEGEIALSYGSGSDRNQYWGLSVWRLRDGATTFSELAVELRGVELKRRWNRRFPFVTHTLVQAHLSSRIRRSTGRFKYPAEFANYVIVFTDASKDSIKGSVRARRAGDESPVQVGLFQAERIA